VPPVAIALVLVAAVLHAGWNVLLKTSGDPLRTAVRLQAFGTLVLAPIAGLAWLAGGRPGIEPAGLVLAAVSAVLETLYFLFLSAGYRRGDLSLVYPLARGSAPLLAVVVGVGLLGERLAPLAWLGVAALLAGILAVARPWRALQAAGAAHRGAVGYALATGVTIAAYSAVDRIGVRLVEPWLYGAILAVLTTVLLGGSVTLGRRSGRLAGPEPDVTQGLRRATPARSPLARDAVAGVLSLTAYLLVLFAYSIAPLAAVAPLREAGIVLAAAWGALRLGEAVGSRDSAVRIGAAGLVVVGAALLVLAD
jgi:drug/metabolite transporter (DMT)-like permease